MRAAIVSAEIAKQFQDYRKGEKMVRFIELSDGTFFAPVEMVALIPEAFPIYKIREISESDIKKSETSREEKVQMITEFMLRSLNVNDFLNFLKDCRTLLQDYIWGSETFYFWVQSGNSVEWGDYTNVGLEFTTYGNHRNQEFILSVLEDREMVIE